MFVALSKVMNISSYASDAIRSEPITSSDQQWTCSATQIDRGQYRLVLLNEQDQKLYQSGIFFSKDLPRLEWAVPNRPIVRVRTTELGSFRLVADRWERIPAR